MRAEMACASGRKFVLCCDELHMTCVSNVSILL